jgi:hypothetical protein
MGGFRELLIEPAGASGVAHAAMQSKSMRDEMSAPADVMIEKQSLARSREHLHLKKFRPQV